jgi:hypothetical protein
MRQKANVSHGTKKYKQDGERATLGSSSNVAVWRASILRCGVNVDGKKKKKRDEEVKKKSKGWGRQIFNYKAKTAFETPISHFLTSSLAQLGTVIQSSEIV